MLSDRSQGPIVVDGYVRVSTVRDRGGPSFISPEVQRDQIEAWAKLNGARIGKVFEELNESGGRSDRPKLLEALDRIESGASQGLVVAKLDRFGRSLIDGLSKIDRIIAAGGIFVSVQDGLDLSTPTGKLVLRIMLSMAEWELDRIRANWLLAKQRAIARGVHVGPYPPFGYRRRKDGRLTPDPKAAPLVEQIFRRRGEGATIRSLAERLSESGLPTGKGSSHFTGAAVQAILKNRAYLGELKLADEVNPTAHPALVDQATWQRAQRPVRSVNSSRASLLGGILRCGTCRMKMTSSSGTQKGVLARPSYMCTRHSSAGTCPDQARVRADEVEGLFEELVFREARRAPDRRSTARIKKAADELQIAERALIAYRDDTSARSALGSGRYAAGLLKRGAEVERRALLLAGARNAAERPAEVPEQIEERWPELSLAERREVIENFLDCAFVMPGDSPARERVHVCRRGEQPPDTPARGYRLRAIRAFDPSSVRTLSLPRPARWDERRTEGELLAWRGGRTDWPNYAEFLRDGRARLYLQICEWGGHTYWSHRLGWEEPRDVKYYWNAERVRGALRPYLEGRETFPTKTEFEALGARSVREAAERRGGIGFWAEEFGVAYRSQMVRRRGSTEGLPGRADEHASARAKRRAGLPPVLRADFLDAADSPVQDARREQD
jgi:site-specific DNA recombinase